MRFVIYGAGGIGGTIGARLHIAGFEVLLIARGAHLDAIQQEGLRFRTPTIDQRLQIPAVSHPREANITALDAVIMCMKSQHTQAALNDLAACASDTTPVICCQNGVANERAALRHFENVYGMVVVLPAEHLNPGEVVNFAEDRAGVLDAGRYPAGADEKITQVTGALDAAGFGAYPDPAIMRQKYAKLLGNLNNAVQAACGEGSQAISRALRNEALACYAAAGINCATPEETRARRADGLRGGEVPGFARHGGSSLQSVLRGTGDIETDYLNGEIVQLGRLHGVPTPANRIVQQLGNRMVRDALTVGAVKIADLGGEIQKASLD